MNINHPKLQHRHQREAARIQAGFSLTEVILAVGVVAFTLTSLTGLMVVGLNTNKNAADETRSIYIAQQLFSDLRGSQGSNGSNAKRQVITKVTQTLNTTRPEARDLLDTNSVLKEMNLGATSGALYIAFDENGDAVGELTPEEFSSGSSLGQFATKIEFAAAMVGATTQPGLKRIKITVGSPARATDLNREHYVYESLVSTL